MKHTLTFFAVVILLIAASLTGKPGNAATAAHNAASPGITAIAFAGGQCDPGGTYYDACEGVGLTTYDTCRAAGGSKPECEQAAKESQNNCLRDFGCPIIN